MANYYHSTFLDLSNLILNFQQHIENYQTEEGEFEQGVRRYFKNLRMIENSILHYK